MGECCVATGTRSRSPASWRSSRSSAPSCSARSSPCAPRSGSTASSPRRARTGRRRWPTAWSGRRAPLPVPRLEVRPRRRVHRPAGGTRRRRTSATGAGHRCEGRGAGRADLGLRRAANRRRAPRFDTYVMDGVRDIGWADLPCNYVQIMENAVDPTTSSGCTGATSGSWAARGLPAPASFGKEHIKIGFTPFEWGIIKRRVLKGATEENDDWKVGHPLVFPYNMRVGGGGRATRCRSGCRSTGRRPGSCSTRCTAPTGYEHVDQPQIPDYQIPVIDENGRHVPTTSRARTSWPG